VAKKSYKGLIRHHKKLFKQKHQMELINSYFSESQSNFWKAISPPPAPCLLSDLHAWNKHFDKIFNPSMPPIVLTEEEKAIKDVLFGLHGCDPSLMVALNAQVTLDEVELAYPSFPTTRLLGQMASPLNV